MTGLTQVPNFNYTSHLDNTELEKQAKTVQDSFQKHVDRTCYERIE